MAEKEKWTRMHTGGLLAIMVVLIWFGLRLFPSFDSLLVSWLFSLMLMTLFTLIAGHGVTGMWKGVFIDERNKMSLSRVQMILWTLLILSAYLTAVLWNLAFPGGAPNPSSVEIPQEVWLLMGISTTSLVGSPLIKGEKKNRADFDRGEWQRTRELLPEKDVVAEGQIVVNSEPQNAKWSDLFRGEEIGNAAYLDLAKIQMLFFTLILALSYAAAIAAMFNKNELIAAFPTFDKSMVVLMGISHAGYLVHKAIPNTKAGRGGGGGSYGDYNI